MAIAKYYIWHGCDQNNHGFTGSLIANNKGAAIHLLKKALISPKKLVAKHTIYNKDTLLLMITEQLATQLEAGLSLIDSLSSLIESSSPTLFTAILSHIKTNIKQGQTLYHSAASLPSFFPSFFLKVLKISEHNGRIAEGLNKINRYMLEQKTLKQTIKKKLRYPVTLFITLLVVLEIMITTVAPQFQQLLSTQGIADSDSKNTLIMMHHWQQHHVKNMLPITILFICCIYSICCLTPHTAQKKWRDYWRNIVFIKKYHYTKYTYFWLNMLHFSLTAELTLIEAITLANEVIYHSELSQPCITILNKLKQGYSLSHAVHEAQAFSRQIVQILAVSESSGTLEKGILNAKNKHHEQLTNFHATLAEYTEPLLLILMAAIIGSTLISIYQSILNLGLKI